MTINAMVELMTTSSSQLADQLALSDQSPKYYRHYPRLFAPYFSEVESSSINRLCDAGYLYYQSLMLIDAVIDEKDFSQIPTSIILQEETIKILTAIFGEKSEFWDLWSAHRLEYFAAVREERKMDLQPLVSFEAYAGLADLKAAFGKVAIDCLWFLSDQKRKETYDTLLESHRLFSIGFQLCDDIRDFKEDLLKGQFNWGVYLLRQHELTKGHKHDASISHKLFYIRGIGQELFQQAIGHFQLALDVIEPIHIASEWGDIVTETQRTAIRDLDIARDYIDSIRQKTSILKKAPSDFFNYATVNSNVVKKALTFIQSQFQDNYPDLKHQMYLGKIDGFENDRQVHESYTFPRAVLNDCLLSLARKYHLDASAFFSIELDYLIEQRNKDEVGGWGYFPTVKEIASDIDDLAQMIQLFTQLERPDLVQKFCDKPIGIALEDRASNDGGIETWIIPKSNQLEIQQKQELFNHTRWGAGPDPEVVANFIYALHVTDSHGNQAQISKSLNYVISTQQPQGYWNSVWYYGSYYGTYVCLRLLSSFGERFSVNAFRAIEYIRNTQNPDGGFGLGPQTESDPLSTSLALLGYSFYCSAKDQIADRALNYLLSCQLDDGSWQAVDFIKPRLLAPYKSKTLTTGYVLKALTQYE